MNLRRGLFRLWIVGALLFVIVVAFIGYTDIKANFEATANEKAAQSTLARFRHRSEYNDLSNAQLADRLYTKFYSDMPREQFDRWITAPQPQRKFVKFRGQLHDFPADVTTKEIAAALETTINDRELMSQLSLSDAEVGIFPPNPWSVLGGWAAIAFGIPLAVLILGASLVWAFSGFAAMRT
jgi:hypothetical protein